MSTEFHKIKFLLNKFRNNEISPEEITQLYQLLKIYAKPQGLTENVKNIRRQLSKVEGEYICVKLLNLITLPFAMIIFLFMAVWIILWIIGVTLYVLNLHKFFEKKLDLLEPLYTNIKDLFIFAVPIFMILSIIYTIVPSQDIKIKYKGLKRFLDDLESPQDLSVEPILFIRSFEDDGLDIYNLPMMIHNGQNVNYQIYSNGFIVFTQMLSDVLLKKFNLFLLGSANPNQVIPPDLTQVLYLNHSWDNPESWRDIVRFLISQGKFIIAIPRYTDGLIWELEQVIELGCIDKLIFVFPPREDHKEIWRLFIQGVQNTDSNLNNLRMPNEIPNFNNLDPIIATFDNGRFNIENLSSSILAFSSNPAEKYRALLTKVINRKLSRVI